MNSYVILALLLICQRNALASEDVINQTSAPPIDPINLSARVLVTPIEPIENPVDLARKLLFELELFNLIGEVVQAKFTKHQNINQLLFEMGSALQAKDVVQACSTEGCPIYGKKLQIFQTKDDFFDEHLMSIADIEYRMA
ncbi:uncharacterized protein LOC117780855 [Drosophila innubila]|uniref:uncharacterized protein LOC117780855 n=1 Tax=Drosophila innubila TaxID=198719 RepID=UPI00148C683B|nr:uncharacterized protein LOC117780855 [Drosophila innubila]